MEKDTITIIDDKNIRGIVGSAKTISKELLEDMIDLIELSSDEVTQETNKRIAEADKKRSWISLGEMKKTVRGTK